MSIARANLINTLKGKIPGELVEGLVKEYESLKAQFALGRFRPAELDGGRFCEYMVRILQHLDGRIYTPLGTSLPRTGEFLEGLSKSSVLNGDTFRYFLPRLVLLLMSIRNRRDVAHVGGEVSPNFADARFICNCADWIMTELIRGFYQCSPDEAKDIVAQLNNTRLPIVEEIAGIRRVLNTSLDTKHKVLVLLYHEYPSSLTEGELRTWLKYQHSSRFRTSILEVLDKDALIVYQGNVCQLTRKGIKYVEENIPLEL